MKPSDEKTPDTTLRNSRDEVLRVAGEMGDALQNARDAMRRKSNPQKPAVRPPAPQREPT